MKKLTQTQMEPLLFPKDASFQYTDMVRIRSPLDSSALFHCILNAIYIPYREESAKRYEFVMALRKEISEKLSSRINGEEESKDGPTFYEILFKEKAAELVKYLPVLNLQSMKDALSGDTPLNLNNLVYYLEIISDVVGLDIYFLDLNAGEVIQLDLDAINTALHQMQRPLPTPPTTSSTPAVSTIQTKKTKKTLLSIPKDKEEETSSSTSKQLKYGLDDFYKNRDSCVLGVLDDHFELIGVKNKDGDVITKFKPKSAFIQTIREQFSS